MNPTAFLRSLLRSWVLPLSLSTAPSMVFAQPRPDTPEMPCSCKEQLQQAIGAMESAIDAAPRNAFAIALRFRAENAQGVQEFDATGHFEQGRIFFETPQYRYYEDEVTRLAVLPEEQAAYVYENPRKKNGVDGHVKTMLMWRDSLMLLGEVSQCRLIHDTRSGERRRIITLEPPERLAWTGVHSITWTIDMDRSRLISATVNYLPGRSLRSMKVDYRRFAPGERDPRAGRSVSASFLTDGGRKGPLKGFVVNDRRRLEQ